MAKSLYTAEITKFQSTLPARGATKSPDETINKALEFQSTLPARGATQLYQGQVENYEFQSTLPARGATLETLQQLPGTHISIHAPREGSDQN